MFDTEHPDIVRVERIDDVECVVKSSVEIAIELREYFSFEVPGFRFMPAYKQKRWDGQVRLFSLGDRRLPIGLLPYLASFCARGKLQMEVDADCYPVRVDLVEAQRFLESLPLRAAGETISFRDYQMHAILDVLRCNRRTIVSPTSSGKSLILYGLCRWFLKNRDEKILLVVPTKNLVRQMASDFQDYSSVDDSFDADEMIHCVMGGIEKSHPRARVIISTWQSIFQEPKEYFDQFGMLLGDECHQFKGDQIRKVATNSKNAKFRAGFTGTLLAKEGAKCHRLQIEGAFGIAVRPKTESGEQVTTKLLMSRDEISKMGIEVINLSYPEELTEQIHSAKDYEGEISEIIKNKRRAQFVCALAAKLEGNVLVLFDRHKHGEMLHEMFCGIADRCSKTGHLIYGKSEDDEREEIRKILEGSSNNVTFASYGVFSTGVSVRNIHHVIFAHPSKSSIRVLQSIGRGLRKAVGKTRVVIHDIADNFARSRPNGRKRSANFLMKHAADRLRIYASEGFEYKIKNIEL